MSRPGERPDLEASLRRKPSTEVVRRFLAAGYAPEAARERWGAYPTYLIRDFERARARDQRAAKRANRART